MQQTEKRKYLSVKEAAKDYFDNLISISTLYNLINKGKIKVIKLGTKTLISISELNSYCNNYLKGDCHEQQKNSNIHI